MILDLSGIYAEDILVGDILYYIPNDLFYKIIRIDIEGDWRVLYTDTNEFSWALDKTERLGKDNFRLYRERVMMYE